MTDTAPAKPWSYGDRCTFGITVTAKLPAGYDLADVLVDYLWTDSEGQVHVAWKARDGQPIYQDEE